MALPLRLRKRARCSKEQLDRQGNQELWLPEISEGKNQRYSIKNSPVGYLLPAGRYLSSLIDILFDFGFLSQQGIIGVADLMAFVIVMILIAQNAGM